MTCHDLLRPYVQWAAQEQVADPNRYVLGITLTATHMGGDIAYVRGYVDVTSARFSKDGTRFVVRLKGAGNRFTTPAQTQIDYLNSGSVTPGNVTANSAVTDDRRPVLIHLDANHEQIRVRVGDVALRKVVDDFLLECRASFLMGFEDDRAYLLSLQRVERTENTWVLVDAPQESTATEQPTVSKSEDAEAPAPEQLDDLQRIEGIGPQAAAALSGLGIETYAQLAVCDPEKLQQELDKTGLNLGPGTAMTWPAQAALAAAGRWNALKYIQDEILKGGRPGLPDDLQRILGIGPALASHLDTMGITTFKQLANADPEQLENDLRATGARITLGTTASWPEQAALARDYKWNELEALQKQLNALNQELDDSDPLVED